MKKKKNDKFLRLLAKVDRQLAKPWGQMTESEREMMARGMFRVLRAVFETRRGRRVSR